MKAKIFILTTIFYVAVSLEVSLPNRSFGILKYEPNPPPPKNDRINSRALSQGIIKQRLDHFDDTNNSTWEMRYFANNEFYLPGGPFFIFVGGEWEIVTGWITGGHMYDMAAKMNGQLFITEHRFYGQSRPTR